MALKQPLREVVCDCGKLLGYVKQYDVTKVHHGDVIQHPWSLAYATELKNVPEEELQKQETKMKRERCVCKNWCSIPN